MRALPCLLLFTKPPRAGRVKTRLVGARVAGRMTSAADATELHRALLADVCERFSDGEGRDLSLCLAWDLEPAEPLPEAPLPPAGVGATRQQGHDLGERLFNALADASRTHPLVAAVGSDHPLLDLATVRRAFDALAAGEGDVALGPSLDGGYYLIAVRREVLSPRLFAEIDWSTERVYGQTRERCRELGLSVVELPVGRDVDRGEDVIALAEEIARREAAGEAVPCPRTRQVLAEWGLLPPAAERRAACAS